MKLISVTSNGNRLAKVLHLYAALFPGRSNLYRVQYINLTNSKLFSMFFGKIRHYKSEQSALKAAEEWLKGAQV